MNIHEYITVDENEKPLDNIVNDGGMCGIFRKICCIGDSLSSGEFEAVGTNGDVYYLDMFDYSWGQYIARDVGCTVYNFSRGGMSAKEYIDTFSHEKGFWSEDLLCHAYIIALGVNDILNLNHPFGDMSDINLEDYTKNNRETFIGCYAYIIQRIKSMQPKARFFLVSMLQTGEVSDPKKKAHRDVLAKLAEFFDYTYLVDLYEYAPLNDEAYKEKFYMHGHLNPAGYRLTAKMIESYIDYIIRHNFSEFKQAGLIGTPYYDDRLEQ